MRIPGDEAFSSYHISTILGDNEHDMKYALSALPGAGFRTRMIFV